MDNIQAQPGNALLLTRLEHAAKLATGSKWSRFTNNPVKYIKGILHRELFYRITRSEWYMATRLFWGVPITVALPASMDIYLTGAKSHDSEIRLARYFIHQLKPGDLVIDVGAHVGYYSMLASCLVGDAGKVISIEPSPTSFSLLKKNTVKFSNIEAFNLALSGENGMITFAEFPGPYAENSAIDPSLFEEQEWYKKAEQKKVTVQAIRGDSLVNRIDKDRVFIKIDVEGAENLVITGWKNFLIGGSPTIVMEFMNESRNNHNHIFADKALKEMGYAAFQIQPGGQLKKINGPTADVVNETGLISENIIYQKL